MDAIAVTTVEFGTGRRPEASMRIRVAAFDGPLGLLLALIESERLDVLTVPLGALAGAYLEALAGLTDDRLANVSSFVAVASQLIVIKSRALLPRQDARPADEVFADEGEDPEAELRARLLLYRAFRDAGITFAARAGRTGGLFRREPATPRRRPSPAPDEGKSKCSIRPSSCVPLTSSSGSFRRSLGPPRPCGGLSPSPTALQ